MEWKDVVEVTYTPPTASKIVCPICLENANVIVAPRVTKCGHIFCWPCLLQYLDFERQKGWKKCPLCADPIYKNDIRRAIIKQAYTNELSFQLMVRNRGNISLKTVTEGDSPVIMGSKLPSVDQENYSNSRIRLCDQAYVTK